MKRCSVCRIEQSFEFFAKSKSGTFGLNSTCKVCDRQKNKERRIANKLKNKNRTDIFIGNKICSRCKTDKPKDNYNISLNETDSLQSYCNDCKHDEYLEDFDRISERNNNWKLKNPERHKSNQIRWNSNPANKLRKSEVDKSWRLANPDKIKEGNARRRKDPKHRTAHNLRSRLLHALKGTVKKSSAVTDLCATIDYINNTYFPSHYHVRKNHKNPEKNGVMMTKDNYGRHGWQIDHDIPLTAFNLEDEFEQRMASHYLNLKPLWAEDNDAKGGANRKKDWTKDKEKLLQRIKDLNEQIMQQTHPYFTHLSIFS